MREGGTVGVGWRSRFVYDGWTTSLVPLLSRPLTLCVNGSAACFHWGLGRMVASRCCRLHVGCKRIPVILEPGWGLVGRGSVIFFQSIVLQRLQVDHFVKRSFCAPPFGRCESLPVSREIDLLRLVSLGACFWARRARLHFDVLSHRTVDLDPYLSLNCWAILCAHVVFGPRDQGRDVLQHFCLAAIETRWSSVVFVFIQSGRPRG